MHVLAKSQQPEPAKHVQEKLYHGDIPISMVLDDSPNKSLHLKLGFSHVCRVVEVYLFNTA